MTLTSIPRNTILIVRAYFFRPSSLLAPASDNVSGPLIYLLCGAVERNGEVLVVLVDALRGDVGRCQLRSFGRKFDAGEE